MRLFVAIELPSDARAHLVKIQNQLRNELHGCSWTREANLHLTLKFFGEVDDAEVPRLCDELKTIPSAGTMRLWSSGMCLFPERGPVRIVGVGLEESSGALCSLVESIDDRGAEFGFKKEGRAYVPHVTLARTKFA